MSTLEGKLVANNMKVGIVVARFNEFITNKLLAWKWLEDESFFNYFTVERLFVFLLHRK